MGKPPLIAGLEIGAYHLSMAVAQLQDRRRLVVRVLESVPARGIERGVLSDPMECTDSIARLIRQAERGLSAKIPPVMVAITGNHLKSCNAAASIPIADPSVGISRRDVERAVATCRTLSLEYDRQILHAYQRGFSVDGQSGIKDPVGLYGTKLGVELHLITALNLAMQNWVKVIQRAGLEVEQMVLPGVAAAEAVLSDLDRDVGVTAVRIGESQTEALLFSEGSVKESFLMPWGTDPLVQAVSRNLKLPWAVAQQLFEKLSSLEERPESGSASPTLRVQSGSQERSFSHAQIAHLVRAKIKEFLGRLQHRMDESAAYRESAAGVVMVGPLTRLEGFLEMAEFILNMPVRLGTVKSLEMDPPVTLTAQHATVLGLLHHGAKRRSSPVQRLPAEGPAWYRWLDRTRRLLEEYF